MRIQSTHSIVIEDHLLPRIFVTVICHYSKAGNHNSRVEASNFTKSHFLFHIYNCEGAKLLRHFSFKIFDSPNFINFLWPCSDIHCQYWKSIVYEHEWSSMLTVKYWNTAKTHALQFVYTRYAFTCTTTSLCYWVRFESLLVQSCTLMHNLYHAVIIHVLSWYGNIFCCIWHFVYFIFNHVKILLLAQSSVVRACHHVW